MSKQIKEFRRILVANRGEIAIRVLRAASELNIRTIAIYTYEDRYSLHRYKADEAYQIGAKDDPLKPYLDIEEIIMVAKREKADAIHPGYGFLSENTTFVRRCQEEGIVFIGPDAEVMEQVGDKVAAKVLARRVNVPVIEDSDKEEQMSDELAFKEAQRIGFPVMVKAVAGGGGRGMRVVRHETEFLTELHEAKREAKTAFGNDDFFIEKFIEDPKHIEVQIIGDKHGNIVHLYERDCSVQRRFQKVVEMAPAPFLPQEVRDRLYKYAKALTQEVNYTHAGTVEFLIDPQHQIYFIEINPRIQVEHTVTEQVTGIDIVRTQILIAMGYALSDDKIFINDQSDIHLNGFALQCRITTEDPFNDFKPDYGRIIAYRSAAGMGIRLDAGSAYPGARISPFFDSMLVKVTAKGRTLKGTSDRMHRALREFRIRGVKTNIGFLLNLLENEDFRSGQVTVSFIQDHPELLNSRGWRDRGTKMLKFLANNIVNGNPDVKFADTKRILTEVDTPSFDASLPYPDGMRAELLKLGPEAFSQQLKQTKKIHYTDTTFRDAHQSLLATRMRTYDMAKVAESYARLHGGHLFSMEVWGGATFDVAMRFLNECPWERLATFRKAMPNVLLQMLLRGSNAVGYAAYPDNLVIKFIEEAAETGIDIFRIFDSLNWVEAMKTSIRTVRERTNAIAEACICYSGDITDPSKTKFTLPYYLDLARELEDEGAHIICIKDMAGLLKPQAATTLITALKETVDLPIHLHTHDTSSIQAATYLKAIEAGVDVVDVAMSSMAGLTSQPSFNSLLEMLDGHERARDFDKKSLNEFAVYWEGVRRYYYPFETELRSGTAEIYQTEIPGGQYSNLRPQARGLGLEDQFETIKKNYVIANELFGNIIKVTPSSKVVGDMAMFMTSNNLTKADVLNPEKNLAFPDSVKALMRGDLGQIQGGFPADIQKLVLKGEKPYTDKPNAHLAPIDFEKEFALFQKEFGSDKKMRDFLSYKLYPKVYSKFVEHEEEYGEMKNLPTPAFFYALQPNEEILIEIGRGKNVIIKYFKLTEPDELGNRMVFFHLNGQMRSITVRDLQIKTDLVVHQKVSGDKQIGTPLQGNLARVLVKEGQEVEENTPLFIIEAMKMESTITAPFGGVVKKIYLGEKTLVEQDDLIIELE